MTALELADPPGMSTLHETNHPLMRPDSSSCENFNYRVRVDMTISIKPNRCQCHERRGARQARLLLQDFNYRKHATCEGKMHLMVHDSGSLVGPGRCVHRGEMSPCLGFGIYTCSLNENDSTSKDWLLNIGHIETSIWI